MFNTLVSKKCLPCEGGLPPLSAEEIERLQKEVPKWEVMNGHHLKRRFKFKNFAEALAFVNSVGALAETENHHPSIRFGWGFAEITTFTHVIDGLSENDFILAAKMEAVLK